MLNRLRPTLALSALACGLFLAPTLAPAQVTGLDKQLSRLDLSVSAMGEFTKGVSGTTIVNAAPITLTQNATTTLGALVTLRYTVSPLIGVEGNYSYARFSENYSTIQGVQTKASEYTVGYVAHTPSFLGVEPFLDAGLGTIAFNPTARGGQGLYTQARAAYYYGLGIDDTLSTHFGVRAAVRQLIYLAPDYGQNYLTIHQRTFSTEPTIGLFVRF